MANTYLASGNYPTYVDQSVSGRLYGRFLRPHGLPRARGP
jgi:hypothetical protein